ncbi:MAG: 30S ribosomal protein S1 [Alphaproteobacteria bacterium]|nr:30S ribosomal protein S1 [Alphaproteobacteria bacterium]
MANSNAAMKENFETSESFADIFEKSLTRGEKSEGTVVTGEVVALERDTVVIDVGLKSEGRVPLREFSRAGEAPEIKVGDKVEVYLERIENRHGEAMLSREKALREEAWTVLERSHERQEKVMGTIFGRVKGGFTVDVQGTVAFLPGSQVDIRPVRDVGPLMGVPQPFMILKMDRKRGNIVVSRRVILEESRQEERDKLLTRISEGDILDGVVKNITDYGAFIDLGGVDGLLHVTDISWKRVNHPSEVLSIGQTVRVQVTKFNTETKRISLGMKQLDANPWTEVAGKFPVGSKHKGKVSNITDYGAFVELDSGIEGLVHVSEMSWTKKNVHPGKIVSTSQEVNVVVLEIDSDKHRISLGMKQCEANPWAAFADSHKEGDILEGKVANIADFGLFVTLTDDLDGLVHETDISWSEPGATAIKNYKKGDSLKVMVLGVDTEKERISLGIKQLEKDPHEEAMSGFKKGKSVTCTVKAIKEDGIEVELSEGITTLIKRNELARDRSDQRPERFAVGDRVDAKVTAFDKTTRKLTLSIKALEMEEEKKAIAEYGSTDSGASLGDILGAALAEGKLNMASEEKPKKAAKKSKKASDDETEE